MANTILTRGVWTQISAMDSDYVPTEDVPLHSIKLIPGAADDILIVRNGSITGPIFCKLESSEGEPRIEYFHGNYAQPCIDYSECTLSVGHSVVIGIDPFHRNIARTGFDPA